MKLQRSLFVIYLLTILLFGCGKTEYVDVEVIREVPIVTQIDDTGFFGGSGLKNGAYREYLASSYYYQDGQLNLVFGQFIWYNNTNWALRDLININGFAPEIELNDTIYINPSMPMGRYYHLYADGDVGGECYSILDNASSKSWVIFSEQDSINKQIAGQIHADFVLDAICGAKLDPNQPDSIRLRDFYFRAKQIN